MSNIREAKAKVISEDMDVSQIELIEVNYGEVAVHWKGVGMATYLETEESKLELEKMANIKSRRG